MSTIEAPVQPTVAPVVQPVTRRDVLHRAADLLEEFGWRQGHVGSKMQGVFCAMGATTEACRDLGTSREVWKDARSHLRKCVGMSVAHWNDADGRTKAEVVARLREAADA